MPKVTKSQIKNLKKMVIRKRANRRNIFVMIAIALVIGAAAFVWTNINNPKDAETYSAGGQTIRLLPDGKFTANLAHGNKKDGTYARIEEGGWTLIVFTESNGNVSEGSIQNDRLYMPSAWDDGHGHGSVLSKVN